MFKLNSLFFSRICVLWDKPTFLLRRIHFAQAYKFFINVYPLLKLFSFYWFFFFYANIYIKNKQRCHSIYIYTRKRNIKYTYKISKFLYYSHAFILRSLFFLTKSKFKNFKFYHMSLGYLISLLKKKKRELDILVFKGPRILTLMFTFGVWRNIPFSKKFKYILQLSSQLSYLKTKKKQSIKRRLRKRLLQFEKFSV